tara:strand:- start:1217 stop:1651 length:435 start_codon:yes stop_codon:yes gene_type:complete
MAFESSGTLEQDIKDIAIKQMGGEETYRSLDAAGRNKIDSYASDLTGAIKAFLERQEFNITDMEAVGMIQPDAIQIVGTSVNVAPGAPAVFLPTPAKPGTIGYASNVNPIPIKVQLSQTSNRVGLPEVLQNVKKTIIKLLNPRD